MKLPNANSRSRRAFLKATALGLTACAFPGWIERVMAAAPEGGILVAYFSWPETLSPYNMSEEEENSTVVIDGKVLGNTQYVAMVIAEATGADLFRIEPLEPYPMSHQPLISQARSEKRRNHRPAMAGDPGDLQRYGTVFLGYPNWWADLPMILYTFLERFDLSGKIVAPFCTHGGSGLSGTVRTIAGLQPKATVVDGCVIHRDVVADAAPEVKSWVRRLGYAG